MAKRTQNRIFAADGTTLKLAAAAATVIVFLTEFDDLRYRQTFNAEKQPLFLDENDKATTVDTGKPFIAAKPRSGYTQYWNNDGFTDPISPENLTPQGVGKLMAKLIQVSEIIQARATIAGADADAIAAAAEMKIVLQGLEDFKTVAAAEAVKTMATIATKDAAEAAKAQNTALKTAVAEVNAAVGNLEVAKENLDSHMTEQGIAPAAVTTAEAVEVAAETSETEDIGEPQAVDAELSIEPAKSA